VSLPSTKFACAAALNCGLFGTLRNYPSAPSWPDSRAWGLSGRL